MDSSKLENIIVDSGAIIKGTGLGSLNKDAKYWTVSEIIAEIRDSRARASLEALPFELSVRTPSDAAMKAVSAFAAKTGDFAALSLPDLKIMALTYDLEMECNGAKNIRFWIHFPKPKAQKIEKKIVSRNVLLSTSNLKCFFGDFGSILASKNQ